MRVNEPKKAIFPRYMGVLARSQFSFWMQDITPDSEDATQKLNDVRRYNASSKITLCTAVKVNPNTALQLAINILENLEALPNKVKDRYNIPQKMKNVQSN